MIKKIFVIQFDEEEKRGFVCSFRDNSHYNKMKEWVKEQPYDDGTKLLDFWGEIEEYGIHEFGMMSNKEFLGFYSAEINIDDRDIVMEKWRNHLSSRDIDCGPVLKFDVVDDYEYAGLELDDNE